jgi:alpha-L-rhamnosidase
MIHLTVKESVLNGSVQLLDFELDAFANLELVIDLQEGTELEIALGEVLSPDGRLNREPGGFRTIRTMLKKLPAGRSIFRFEIPKHQSPYPHTHSVPTPTEADGEIAPFRYVEINGGRGNATLRRREIYSDFDDNAAHFECSDMRLNRIWALCKHTMKATSAFGIYIDGERERKPYEGDAFINQLGHFCCDANYSVAKSTIEHFLNSPTYPTEWQLLTPMLARDYALYSGDTHSLKEWLPTLKERTLLQLAGDDWLIRETEDIRDIVDWPPEERDDYEFGEVNLIPNCYHFGALMTLARITGDNFFRSRARAVKQSIYEQMFRNGLFTDHPGSDHTSLHSAIFPLFFDLADDPEPLKSLILGKGMSCSVYGAHFLLETCFRHGLASHAFGLLTATGLRSWQNMLDKGATITMEAWDDSLKPNQDWNHAWGAAPANIIPRFIGGVRPLAPGFARFEVDPQPAGLEYFQLQHPTIHGSIILEFTKGALQLTVPPGTIAKYQDKEFFPGTHQLSKKMSGYHHALPPALCCPVSAHTCAASVCQRPR